MAVPQVVPVGAQLPAPPMPALLPPVPALAPPMPAMLPPMPALLPPAPAVLPPLPAMLPPLPAVLPPLPAVLPPLPAVIPPLPAVLPPLPAVLPPLPPVAPADPLAPASVPALPPGEFSAELPLVPAALGSPPLENEPAVPMTMVLGAPAAAAPAPPLFGGLLSEEVAHATGNAAAVTNRTNTEEWRIANAYHDWFRPGTGSSS